MEGLPELSRFLVGLNKFLLLPLSSWALLMFLEARARLALIAQGIPNMCIVMQSYR